MDAIKKGWQRFLSYGWKGWLFMFISPSYHWAYFAEGFIEPNAQVWTRYAVDVILSWALIEIITQAKEGKTPKKRTYKPRKKNI